MRTHRGIIAFFALAAFLPGLRLQAEASASGDPLRAELIVGGLPETETERIRSGLPFSEGSRFASIEEARRLAGLAEAYLEQSEEFSGVDVEVAELGEGEISISLFPHPATVSSLSLFESRTTVFPNFPVYGLGTGFSIGAAEQLLCLDLPVLKGISLDALGGMSLAPGGSLALGGKAGISLKPLPLLKAYALGGADFYLNGDYSGAGGSARPTDVYAKCGFLLNLEFLSRIMLVGPSLEASLRMGFLGYEYSAYRVATGALLSPFDFLKVKGRISAYLASGEIPPLVRANNAGTEGLRLTGGIADEAGLASASLTLDIPLPLSLNLGFFSVSFSPFGFLESSAPFSGLDGFTSVFSSPSGAFDSSAGGGVLISLSPPLSLAGELGGGYSLGKGEWSFLFRLR
jgi:hypothetical protein